MAVERFETQIAGRTLTLEAGRMAGLANGAVLVRYGDTVLLCTATTSEGPREGIDFFPLTVEFEEKMYAAGKFPGGFIKREGRPSEQAILCARLTDRPIRPLFPKEYRNDVQVISTLLSADQANDPAILSIIGASAALTISDIPFHGPVGAVKLGLVEGEVLVNPTLPELAYSQLDLTLAGTADALLMVEAGAQEVPEDVILRAFEVGHAAMQPIIQLQNEMRERFGKTKRTFIVPELPPDLMDEIKSFVGTRIEDAIFNADKAGREDATRELRSEVLQHFTDRYEPREVAQVFDKLEKNLVRRNILEQGRRPDGRGRTEIRPISIEVGVLPRTHGSALFTRGQTQALSITTLGTAGDMQVLDTTWPDTSKRYLHQYNFPPYSVGETRPLRGPSRRDIGHGALAERSLLPVLPDLTEFPYAIRVVSEILSSNGSTSMASVCGSTLSLMDAGVPIKAPVAGIAMGLVTPPEGGLDRYAILTDIQGIEDMLGDMDFKVAGTGRGITGLQMDIKLRGVSRAILEQALGQARDARLFILNKMREVIEQPRVELSAFAPRITKIRINPDRIRDVIGPGGKMIRKIIEETKVTIDIEDSGTVLIGSSNPENTQKAIEIIERLTHDVEAGQVFTGKVTRLMAFGAFVEILPGKEGLVHISELANYRVPKVEDVVQVGDEVKVVVTEIDRQGRINLSRRALMEPEPGEGGAGPEGEGEEQRPPFREGGPRPGGGGFRGPRSGPGGDGHGRGGPGRGPGGPPRRGGGFGEGGPRR